MVNFKEVKNNLRKMIGQNIRISNGKKNLDSFIGVLLFGSIYNHKEFVPCQMDECTSVKNTKDYSNPGFYVINTDRNLALNFKISDVYHNKLNVVKL